MHIQTVLMIVWLHHFYLKCRNFFKRRLSSVPGYRNSEYFRLERYLIHTDGDDITVISTGAETTYRDGICVFQLPYPAPFLPSMTPKQHAGPGLYHRDNRESINKPGLSFYPVRERRGSSNKTTLVQATKSISTRNPLKPFS